jgi:glycosyltransferase involved in cell wall biosynthesis
LRGKGLKILIIDSAFLNIQSPFRYIEHYSLLKRYPSTQGWNPALNLHYPQARQPEHSTEPPKQTFDYGYTTGLQQAFDYLKYFEQLNLKFCFTLYPGFTFFINDPHTNMMLDTVLKHPLLHKVFTTTKTAVDYLAQRDYHNIIHHCGGLVVHTEHIKPKRDKPIIWFCAWGRYQNEGTIKGFDLFYKTAQAMPDYQFAAYADWIWKPLPNLTLYPFTPVDTILDRYHFGDIFLATGRALDGKFDGFPTGGAVEAGLAGCALVVSDPLNNNEHLEHGNHAYIVEPKFEQVLNAVQTLGSDENKRSAIAQSGLDKLKEVYDVEKQMEARYRLFE